jgi:DNA-binding transcriptional LysR family regulator
LVADLDLRRLRYFVTTAEELHFGRAAARLHITQQTLSTQIAKLEGDLGTALLTRSSRRVDLTPAGRALLSEGRDLLRHAEATQARALRLKHAAWLRVGVHVTAFTETTSTLLRDFTAANPELSVEIQTYGLAEPAAGLLDGRSDIAVVRPPVAAPDLEFHVLGEESRVFVVPADDPLADRGVLTLDDVRGHAWVAAPAATDGTQPQVWRDFWLPPPLRDGQPATIGATATTLDAWREYVAAGRGISLCPTSSERFYARPGIAFVAATNVPPCHVSLAWNPSNATAAARRLIDHARSHRPA